jgi:hypothetical protein
LVPVAEITPPLMANTLKILNSFRATTVG